MTAIPFVGKCFPTSAKFSEYLDTVEFGAWRPKFVTMHHTGGPSLKTWEGYGNRPKPITDEQWMKNLASYYGNEMKWSAGPHFFFTPKNFCVLSLPNKKGVHAKSFNAMSWGVECVGDFDSEQFTPALANWYAEGLACLHTALGITPGPYRYQTSGLHFHRDDPLTSKTCPGKKVNKGQMIDLVQAKMADMSEGAHEDDDPIPAPVSMPVRSGVINVAANDFLNIRDEASGKSPVVKVLHRGDPVSIVGEVSNAGTLWYKLDTGDFAAARYVTLV
jgi:hypothetical protein